MRSFPAFAVRRPITILMLTLGLMLIGVVSLFQLPVELMPNISFGQISIIAEIRGGIPPTEVETLVTKPIEEAVSSVGNLKDIISVSKEGLATIIMEFEPGSDMDIAAMEVREKFARIRKDLPKQMEKPVIAKYEYADVPVLILAVMNLVEWQPVFTSGGEEKPVLGEGILPEKGPYSVEQLRRIVDEEIKDRLQRIEGVANIEVSGGRERKILVEIEQSKLMAYHLPIEQVINILSLNNLSLLAGDIQKVENKYLVRVLGEFRDTHEIEQIGIALTPQGSILRLKDIARVEDSYLEPSSLSRLNERPVVSLYIQKESTANTVKVVEAILRETEKIPPMIKRDIRMTPTSNQAEFIKKAIDTVRESMILGAVIAILILALFFIKEKLLIRLCSFLVILLTAGFFLSYWEIIPRQTLLYFSYAVLALMAGIGVYRKSLRPTFVIALGIPISVIATFAALYFGKFTLNVMTLSGLALGVGMLVDNGIVVLENIFAHREKEKGKEKGLIPSAIKGSTEVFIAITASTLTTMIVFLPLVFVNPEISLLYAGFSMSVILSLFFSLLVAVTLIPAVSARISFSTDGTDIREPQGDYQKDLEWVLKRRRWISFSTAGTEMTGLQGYYQGTLEWVLKRRYWILAAVLLAFAASAWSLKARDKEFIGTTEQNKFTIFIELPTGAKLEVSDLMVAKVEAILKEIPEIKTASARVEKWSSKIYVELNPTAIRSKTTKQVIEEIRPKTDKLQPAFIYFEESEELGTKEVILDIFGHDYDVLRELAIAIARQMEQVPGLTDVKIRMREGRPELGLLIDKERAALFGLTVADIAETLHAEMRGLVATRYHTAAKEVETIARLQEHDRRTFDQLRKLVLSSPLYTGEGNSIYLEQVSRFDFRLGPSEIWRKNKNRMVQVSANIGAYPLSRAVEKISQAIRGVAVPKEYFYQFGGNYEKLTQNQKEMTFAFIVTLILVYLVLASIFESYLQPFIIITTVPMGAIGVAVSLAIARKPIGIGVLMGGIMLAGIVVNNAIVFVDRVNALRKENDSGFAPRRETGAFFQFGLLVRAAKDRLRPILMTSSTTILGLIPMALDRSEAANLWSPLAITVIGGMMSSTLLTLFLIPSLYLILEDGRKFLKKKGSFSK